MTSTTFFFIFVPILAIILLAVNLIFAPHNPYQEKDSAFECGFHSFLGQNRTQFSISFFIFALLFLLFDLEILLVYPYVVSAYTNGIYGLVIMLVFFLALTLGFAFELGKNALKIDSRQMFTLNNNNTNLVSFISSINKPSLLNYENLKFSFFYVIKINFSFKSLINYIRIVALGLIVVFAISLFGITPQEFLIIKIQFILSLVFISSCFLGSDLNGFLTELTNIFYNINRISMYIYIIGLILAIVIIKSLSIAILLTCNIILPLDIMVLLGTGILKMDFSKILHGWPPSTGASGSSNSQGPQPPQGPGGSPLPLNSGEEDQGDNASTSMNTDNNTVGTLSNNEVSKILLSKKQAYFNHKGGGIVYFSELNWPDINQKHSCQAVVSHFLISNTHLDKYNAIVNNPNPNWSKLLVSNELVARLARN